MHGNSYLAALLQVVGGALLLAGAQGEQHVNRCRMCHHVLLDMLCPLQPCCH